jgi:DDE superfamily endonuclease
MQALLAEHAWDWTAALAALQRFIIARLGDPEAIIVLDETAELKKGDRDRRGRPATCRDHAQVENCQTVVFAAYVTVRAHALFDFRLYLSRAKPALGTAVITGAAAPGVPFAWAAAH